MLTTKSKKQKRRELNKNRVVRLQIQQMSNAEQWQACLSPQMYQLYTQLLQHYQHGYVNSVEFKREMDQLNLYRLAYLQVEKIIADYLLVSMYFFIYKLL